MPVQDDLSVALARLGMLGTTSDATMRSVLLSVVVDLFVGRKHHAPADVDMFAAMIGPLVEGTSAATRRRLVDKLYGHPSAPAALVAELLDDESLIEVDVFKHATLSEEQLLAAAGSGPAMIAVAVAQRASLPDAVTAVLVTRPEPCVIATLVDNGQIAFSPTQIGVLVGRAAADPRLAERLVPRIPDPLAAAPLFPIVSSRARKLVLDALRLQALGRREWGRPEHASVALSERLDRLVLGGEWDGFDEVLCVAIGYDRSRLLPLLHDGRGEVLAVALAAAGVPGTVAARVFILGEPLIGRSVPAVRRLTSIVETLSASAARGLLAAMLAERPAATRATPKRHSGPGRRGDVSGDPAERRREATGSALQRQAG